MKIAYKNLLTRIKSKPSIEELSEKLFQLGHEHEILDGVYHMELTPNRGDCLSIIGLLRDLSVFYEINDHYEIYKEKIKTFPLNFKNNRKDLCPNICFLKIEIENDILKYNHDLEEYFYHSKTSKKNFFTDISNYISYETGQPTHCYDALALGNDITLDIVDSNVKFLSLLDKEIELKGKNLAFLKDNQVINLAGVIGDMSTSCTKDTRSAIIECAYFNPEDIIGKTIKYDIQSDAAHKFERGVDPLCHEFVLKRFIKIVKDHSNIKNIELYIEESNIFKNRLIPFDTILINKIIGMDIEYAEMQTYLHKLGFNFEDDLIEIPSYRSDIFSINDIAEEIARVIGYDNIPLKGINIDFKKTQDDNSLEQIVKTFLIDNEFYEVINNPFVSNLSDNGIKVDNPLDSNKKYLRTSLKESLVNNLLFNERRQKDSIKLFEVSDVYFVSDPLKKIRVLGIIASGRLGKNYRDFSKKIDGNYFLSIIDGFMIKESYQIETIKRDELNSKIKNEILYIEIILDEVDSKILEYKKISSRPIEFNTYKPISEFPSSSRDLSFLIEDSKQSLELERLIKTFKHDLLKEVFLFDYYENHSNSQIKMAYRFIFQSDDRTITEKDVTSAMNDIIRKSREINSISIPGLKK
jgi:phenylalanyl-tRNA synthetase beta chain